MKRTSSRFIPLLATATILWACSDTNSILSPPDQPAYDIVDGARSSAAAGFYFLPPLVPAAKFVGQFDPAARPIVEICRPIGTACSLPVVAAFTMDGKGNDAVKVDVAAQKYHVTWKTGGALDPANAYRIRVRAGGTQLGYADVKLVRTGKEAQAVDATRYIAIVNGSTQPIAFRIEKGAIPPAGPPAVRMTASSGGSSSIGAGGGTVSATMDGIQYVLTVPAGALLDPVRIGMTPIVRMDNLPLRGGLAAGVVLEPSGLAFLKPATLNISFPAGTSTRNLMAFGFSETGVGFHLTPSTSAGVSAQMQISHFSGAGVGDAEDEDVIVLRTETIRTQDEAEAAIAIVQRDALENGGAGNEEQRAEITRILSEWYANGIGPRLALAEVTKARLTGDVSEFQRWVQLGQLLDVSLPSQEAAGRASIVRGLRNAIRTAHATCASERDVARAAEMLRWADMASKLALDENAGLGMGEVLADICVNPTVRQVDIPANLPSDAKTSVKLTIEKVFNAPAPEPGPAAAPIPTPFALQTVPTAGGKPGFAAAGVMRALRAADDAKLFVTIRPSGTTDDAVRSGNADAEGLFAMEVTPAPGAANVTLDVQVCLRSETETRLNLICKDDLIVRPVGATRVYTGDFTANTDAQLLEMAGVSEITGSLTLNGVTDLRPLASLKKVGGYLVLYSVQASDVGPLSKLEQVAGDLSIYTSPRLTNLSGFRNVNTVGGNLTIYGNPALNDIAGLSTLRSIGGLGINDNGALGSLRGIEGITTLGGTGTVYIGSSIAMDLSAMSAIASQIRELNIYGAVPLNLAPLSGIVTLRSLALQGALDPASLTSLRTIDGSLRIDGTATPALTEYKLPALESVKELDIYMSANLPSLRTVAGRLTIANSGARPVTVKLPALTSVTQTVTINGAGLQTVTMPNASVSSYVDISYTTNATISLGNIGLDLIVHDNTSSNLALIRAGTIARDLDIQNNPGSSLGPIVVRASRRVFIRHESFNAACGYANSVSTPRRVVNGAGFTGLCEFQEE